MFKYNKICSNIKIQSYFIIWLNVLIYNKLCLDIVRYVQYNKQFLDAVIYAHIYSYIVDIIRYAQVQ